MAMPSGWLNAQDCGASGSAFRTSATTLAGSRDLTVADAGDFKVGHEIMVAKCNLRITDLQIWGPEFEKSAPLKEGFEVRGYDGSLGNWTVYLIDLPKSTPPTFRWSDDLCLTWKESNVPITGAWQKLSGGVEVRFGQRDWSAGYVVVFNGRDQLVSTIEKVAGKVLTLKDATPLAVTEAVVEHSDRLPLQAAIDQAIREKRNLYIPPGHYRLSEGLKVRNATGLTIEGPNGLDTVLDLSNGRGACFELSYGTEVNLRNLRMLGHTGFAQRAQAGGLNTLGAGGLWGFYFKPCHAVSIAGTERVLVENCHASRMSGECFVSGGPSRATDKPGRSYSKQVTYLRCSVTDSARNAFNDWSCGPENTSVLNCRIVDVGGNAWEGAGRFTKFVGNYVRNAGPVAMGNLGPPNRDVSFETVGAAQHLVADNVFEGVMPYGNVAICAQRGSTQIVISNNLFINFESNAVSVTNRCDERHVPTSNVTVVGNLFDMTSVSGTSKPRCAVEVSASDTLVSNNQVYVRGACDPQVTGIRLQEPAFNLAVHDNLIRNCGRGIMTSRGQALVKTVVDGRTFVPSWWQGLPFAPPQSHLYRGWNLVWLGGATSTPLSVIEVFDPATQQLRLKEPAPIKEKAAFHVFPPGAANWTLASNTVTGCLEPVRLDSYGSEASFFRDNLVSRGEAQGVKQAVSLAGQFTLIGNTISGFDEPGSTALLLTLDPVGRVARNLIQRNTFERCATVVKEAREGVWKECIADGNLFVNCQTPPGTGGTVVRREPTEPSAER
jgi:hypothetical protein